MAHTLNINALYIEEAMPEFGIGGVITYHNTGIGFAYEDYIEIGASGRETILKFDPENETPEAVCIRNANIIVGAAMAEYSNIFNNDVESDNLG